LRWGLGKVDSRCAEHRESARETLKGDVFALPASTVSKPSAVLAVSPDLSSSSSAFPRGPTLTRFIARLIPATTKTNVIDF
jgi:hypothetical protein